MVGKTNKATTSTDDYIITGTVILVAIGLIDIYFNPEIPSNSKSIVMLSIGMISAIVFIILKINKLEREIDSLRR